VISNGLGGNKAGMNKQEPEANRCARVVDRGGIQQRLGNGYYEAVKNLVGI